jgi:hypothetical protein
MNSTVIASGILSAGFATFFTWLTLLCLDHRHRTEKRIDPRTGRPIGDHGSAEAAIEFARAHAGNSHELIAFLEAWTEGRAFEEWPEFYTWLAKKEPLA